MLIVLGIFASLLIITALSWMIETLVEKFIGAPLDIFFPEWKKYKPLLMYVPVALGIWAAFIFNFDLLYLLGLFMEIILKSISDELGRAVIMPIAIGITVFGKVITGFAIGAGSNYLHTLIQKWFKKPVDPNEKP